jgi:hypothetical protein
MRHHPPMKTAIALAAGLVLLGPACSSKDSTANSAGPTCNLTNASNGCLRCQARNCSRQLDFCFGTGFHQGELISADSSNSSSACFAFSHCLQTCGCLDDCFRTCDPDIRAACGECQQKYLLPCWTQFCAAECGPGDAGS